MYRKLRLQKTQNNLYSYRRSCLTAPSLLEETMKFIIKHDIRGRLRIHMVQSRMSYEEADTLLYYIENLSGVTSAKVFERTL